MMSDESVSQPPAIRPKRRPRYPGRNPRKFEEKYKEHNPARYADTVEKVLASGKTPAGTHRPIMALEILEMLAPRGDTNWLGSVNEPAGFNPDWCDITNATLQLRGTTGAGEPGKQAASPQRSEHG
jgi:hypothetical protein